MDNHPTFSAQEAAERLNISRATLYAYVSRGLIRSLPHSKDSRQRRYIASDIEALLKRKIVRKDPQSAAKGTLYWGIPLLDSALTLIKDGNLFYRGEDAIELAQSQSLEAVATLLWTGQLDSGTFEMDTPIRIDLTGLTNLTSLARMQVALALAASDDLRAYDLRQENMSSVGMRILRLLVEAATLHHFEADSIASHLSTAWIPYNPHGTKLLNLAMILCADHELNVSSFTARVVSSSGATLYAIVNAGLSALSGIKHGGMTIQVESLFREIAFVGDARQVISQRLQRGEAVPGFGHRLYPEGDPRGMELIQQAFNHGTLDDIAFIQAIIDAGYSALGDAPTLDFGLCALSYVLHLTPEAPLTIFALGRSIGWIAHAIEQNNTPTLIRPRANYIGTMP